MGDAVEGLMGMCAQECNLSDTSDVKPNCGLDARGTDGLEDRLQHFPMQGAFVASVIVHGRDVGPRLSRDVSYRRVSETLCGEQARRTSV